MKDFERIDILIKDKDNFMRAIYDEVKRLNHHANNKPSPNIEILLLLMSNSLQRILLQSIGINSKEKIDMDYCNSHKLPLGVS